MNVSKFILAIRPFRVLMITVAACFHFLWATSPVHGAHAKWNIPELVYEVCLDELGSLQAMAFFMQAVEDHPEICAEFSEQAGFLEIRYCGLNASSSQLDALIASVRTQALNASQNLSKEDFGNILINLEQVYGVGLLQFMMGIEQGRNSTCAISDPFCTGEVYTFPAGVNSGTGEPGPDYDCLITQPNPAWYHMRILLPGAIQITMSSNPSEDIDFILWGLLTIHLHLVPQV